MFTFVADMNNLITCRPPKKDKTLKKKLQEIANKKHYSLNELVYEQLIKLINKK